MLDSLLDLLHRTRPPVAWTNSSRRVVDHFLDQRKPVHRLTILSSMDKLEPDEVQGHFGALEDIITMGLQGVPVYLENQYLSETEVVDSRGKVFQIGENYLEAELMTANYQPKAIQVDVYGEHCSEVEGILEALKPWVRKKPPIETSSRVYTMVTAQDGFAIRNIGKTEVNLEPGNYAPEAVARYHHISDCLDSTEPCGRFCLFDGPPGTGKSYLIRCLISNLDAVFVLIPTTMLGSLSGPSLLPTFLNLQAHKKPIVLVLEDADAALVSRKVNRGNPAALAEMLNLGDGLIGEMLDLRIIATTNAERIELDPAITRPGRMCTHLTLGELDAPQLADIYNRLTKNDQGLALVQKTHAKTLAEVYRLARDAAWAPEAKAAGAAAGTYV